VVRRESSEEIARRLRTSQAGALSKYRVDPGGILVAGGSGIRHHNDSSIIIE
jgi:hypothetical protein